MPRHARGAARFASVASALALAALAVAGPSRAGVSPFPPIDLGDVPVGTAGQYDVVIPLTLPITSIPSAYDATVLFVAGDATTETALNLLGFASPVTVAQVKALLPAAAAVIAPPTLAFSSASGGIAVAALGCTAADCTWRLSWNLAAPGDYDAHLELAPPSVTIVNGGLLGDLLSLLYPLLRSFLESYLHYDVAVTAVAAPVASGPSVPVPAPGGATLIVLGIALAALAALAIARRR